MKGKMLFVFFIIIAVLIALVGRLAYIQLKSGDRYAKIILNQQEYSSKTIPFRRGDIVDRKGTVLATSTDCLQCHFRLQCSDIQGTVFGADHRGNGAVFWRRRNRTSGIRQ